MQPHFAASVECLMVWCQYHITLTECRYEHTAVSEKMMQSVIMLAITVKAIGNRLLDIFSA